MAFPAEAPEILDPARRVEVQNRLTAYPVAVPPMEAHLAEVLRVQVGLMQTEGASLGI